MFSLIAIGIKLGLAFFKRDSSFFFTGLPDILPKKVMKYSHVDFLFIYFTQSWSDEWFYWPK